MKAKFELNEYETRAFALAKLVLQKRNKTLYNFEAQREARVIVEAVKDEYGFTISQARKLWLAMGLDENGKRTGRAPAKIIVREAMALQKAAGAGRH